MNNSSFARIRALPLGDQSFSDLRANDKIYVDKTELIFRLVNHVSYVFLLRPNHFGKSLLSSTVESLFKYGLRNFRGLAIEKLWDERKPLNRDCMVCHIDFSKLCGFSDFPQFENAFHQMLNDFISEYPVDSPAMEICSDALARFYVWMEVQREREPNKTVMLIDNCDAPLNDCVDRPKIFERIQLLLADFYCHLKSDADTFRFLLITGTLRHSYGMMFAGLNYLNDITFNDRYGTLLGFTEKELKDCFAPYIQHAADTLELSFDDCLAKIKENYGNYCFDLLASTNVFCPAPVLKFLSAPELGFKPYQNRSDDIASKVLSYAKQHAQKTIIGTTEEHYNFIDYLGRNIDPNRINEVALLYGMGYFSIEKNDSGVLTVKCPNRAAEALMRSI